MIQNIVRTAITILCISGLPLWAQMQIPFVYNKEHTEQKHLPMEVPQMENLPITHTLPDPLRRMDGSGRTTDFKDWKHRRTEIAQLFQHYIIGEKPFTPKENISAILRNDTLLVTIRERGETLVLSASIKYPEGEGPFPAIIGIGRPTGSLPRALFEKRNIAQITFRFEQVMSHTQKRGSEPINRLYPGHVGIGAYSAWAWGVSRLIDGLEIVRRESRIDLSRLAISGCSFAGKMALYAGAFDERIALTIAQEPGGGGVASWRVSETLGNVEKLGKTSRAWFLESMFRFSEANVNRLPIDQHELAAMVAPRALLILGNTDYEWLAEESGYVACQAARTVWKTFGIADRMGFSIQGGHMHCVLPESQYADVEAFIDKYLLNKQEVDTNITKAPMFKDVDYRRWMPWAK